MSAIPAGFGAGRHREEAERPPERGVRAGEEGESGVIETSLRRRGWHLFGGAPVLGEPVLSSADSEVRHDLELLLTRQVISVYITPEHVFAVRP